jgi:hypothetical protein
VTLLLYRAYEFLESQAYLDTIIPTTEVLDEPLTDTATLDE